MYRQILFPEGNPYVCKTDKEFEKMKRKYKLIQLSNITYFAEGLKMKNTIKRNSILIIAEAQTNSNAFGIGEIISHYKDECGRWIMIDSNGKRWSDFVSNMRNENYCKFIEQYSMSDIIYYLMDKNSDYQTVFTEFLIDAIKETLNTIQVCCLDDVYKYISENLI